MDNISDVQYAVWQYIHETYEWSHIRDSRNDGIVVSCLIDKLQILGSITRHRLKKSHKELVYKRELVYQSDYGNPKLFDEIHEILANGASGSFLLSDCRLELGK